MLHLPPPEPMHETVSPEATEFFGAANFLVVKLTDYCNLKCKYCHQDALVGKPLIMPMEGFKNSLRLILKPSLAPTVYVQFHGGEPLLADDDFFREAVRFARSELDRPDRPDRPGRRVEFFIQTNLTRLSAERQRLLKELEVGISFSIDGPPKVNDDMRGGGEQIQRNWRRMYSEGVEAGAICLIQPSNWDRMEEVLDYFEREGILNVRFNLMVPDGRGKEVDTLTTEKLFNAKKLVLERMLETDGQGVVDATLYNMMKRFVKPLGSPATAEYHGCESLYCQAGRTLYSVNPDGRFFACDRIAESPSWSMGNVNSPFGPAERDLALRKRRAFHKKDDWWARCEQCPAKKICEFSCSAYYVDQVDTREVECQYTKQMWDYFLARKEDIRSFMRKGVQPVFIDERLPLDAQSEEAVSIQDIALDAAYAALSSVDTLASNPHFQLLQRGEQFYVYVFGRNKLFEVDALVAEIAQFNGVLSPEFIEQVLAAKHPDGALRAALTNVRQYIPEIFEQISRARQASAVEHVREHGHHTCGAGSG